IRADSLQKLPLLTSLTLGNVNQIGFLSTLNAPKKLTFLEVVYNTKIKDLTALEGLINLEKINLESCTTLTILDGIEKMTKLRTLNLDNTSIKDLKPLQKLEHLTTAHLVGTDIHSLRGLPSNVTGLIIKRN
ncbi:MAG: hypothetical protein GY789_04530, partial [Hyphomicrobiales bacterium]|nr:hypothetical protein [Hyphomicrobiales bacterium]